MHHYRQALLRMRQGDSDRDIAGARVMGRPKAAQWRPRVRHFRPVFERFEGAGLNESRA